MTVNCLVPLSEVVNLIKKVFVAIGNAIKPEDATLLWKFNFLHPLSLIFTCTEFTELLALEIVETIPETVGPT